jgi:hypothetical protein
MRRILPLISALMLVLILWTGSAAHAAEAMECGVTTVEAAGHYEGDGDEVPADSNQGSPHHHSACHGHCAALPGGAEGSSLHGGGSAILGMGAASAGHGTEPIAEIRPPIA